MEMGEESSLSAGSIFCAFGVNKDADKGNLKRGTVSNTARQFRFLPPISTPMQRNAVWCFRPRLSTSFTFFISSFIFGV